MINCEDIVEKLSEYIDGVLNEEEKLEIEKHLNKCSNCKQEYDELIKFKELINTLGEEELPDNFTSTLHDRLVKDKKGYESENKLYTILKVFSGIAAVFLIIFFMKDSFIFDNMKNDMAANSSSENPVMSQEQEIGKGDLKNGVSDDREQFNDENFTQKSAAKNENKDLLDESETEFPDYDIETIKKILDEENLKLEFDTTKIISFIVEKDKSDKIINKIKNSIIVEIDIETKVVNYKAEIMQLEYNLNVINERLKELEGLTDSNYDDEIRELKINKNEISNSINRLKNDEGKIKVILKLK